MHDAYASIYRINMLIFKISELNCADILFSMQYRKSHLIKCDRIYIRVVVMCFPCVLWTIYSQTVNI